MQSEAVLTVVNQWPGKGKSAGEVTLIDAEGSPALTQSAELRPD